MIPFIIQGQNIVLYVSGQPVIVDQSHINYNSVKEAIKAGDWEAVKTLSSVKNAVNSLSNGLVKIVNDEVLFKGAVVHNALTRRMLAMFQDGFPISHFCKFMENLDANPSYRARNELYGFLEACDLPITDDGCFLAYKKIKSDWTDCYTGKIDNSIGAKPTMPRRDVNEDPNQTCSAGLHVCSYSYLKSYGGDRIVAVKINPADVVAVPTDYNNAKMRVCQYEVVEELPFDAAQKDDALSSGPAVRTGFTIASVTSTRVHKKSYRVEDILEDMDLDDFKSLCEELDVQYYDDWEDEWEMTSLIDDVKIGDIRRAIDKLNLA
jgi:hypothetical protein